MVARDFKCTPPGRITSIHCPQGLDLQQALSQKYVVSLNFEVFLIATATAVAVAQVPICSQTSTSEAAYGQKRVAIIEGDFAGSLVAYRLYDEY